jgi:PAS domain S-box-containing protein
MAGGRKAATAASRQDQFRGYATRNRFIGLAALGYAVVATAWILLSDRLLAGFADAATITWLATVKGLVFVAVTTTLFVLALYFVPASPRSAAQTPGRPWPLVVGFLVVACVVVVGTLVTYQVAVAALRSASLLAVTSVASQKAEQVTYWLGNKRDEALTATHDPAFSKVLATWTAHPDGTALAALTGALRRIQSITGSRGVYLVSSNGGALLGTGPPLPDSPQRQDAVDRATLTGQVALIDLHRQKQSASDAGDLHFGYVVPLQAAEPGSPLRLALFDWDPAGTLFSTLAGWPVPSRTGKTLLVRDDATAGGVPIVLAPLPDAGLVGFGRPLVVGDDMLTASAPVSGSPWRVVAKLDVAEALGGVPKLLLLTGVGRMAILVAALAAFALLCQRLRLRMALAEVAHSEELLKAEARFRATFDQAAVGIAHISPDGRFLRVNRKICETSGYGREQLVGRSAQDFVVPEQRDEVLAALRNVATGEIDSYADDRRYVDAQGQILDLLVTVSMVHDRAEPPYFLVVAQEIGARKQAEAGLRRLTADLEKRVEAEVAARETALARAVHAERIQALGQLAGGIAHDFNNVLQAVMGAATLIERRPTDEAVVRRLARLAIEAVERGASTTRRLLAFGHRSELRAESLDVATLLTDLREILVHTLRATIEVQIKSGADLPPLFADKGQLETALVNLATNARDAMPEGGQLTLSAEAEVVGYQGSTHPAGLAPGRYVRLTVADTGAGMDAATLAHAGEPFFTTKELGAGTGLGLPMAKGFAEQSGGALSIESSPGKGTTITLWLPAAGSVATIPKNAQGDPAGIAAITGKLAPTSVLLVDDEDLVRKAIAENLQDVGYEVHTAANGSEAVAILAGRTAVDVLVTDLSMPGLDGLAVIRAVREFRPGLPALLLTGYAGDAADLSMAGVGGGAFALLRKPVSDLQLVDRVRMLLATRVLPDGAPANGDA